MGNYDHVLRVLRLPKQDESATEKRDDTVDDLLALEPMKAPPNGLRFHLDIRHFATRSGIVCAFAEPIDTPAPV